MAASHWTHKQFTANAKLVPCVHATSPSPHQCGFKPKRAYWLAPLRSHLYSVLKKLENFLIGKEKVTAWLNPHSTPGKTLFSPQNPSYITPRFHAQSHTSEVSILQNRHARSTTSSAQYGGVSGLTMSDSKAPPPALPPLYKQKSWSPDTYRDEAWLKRKDSNRRRRRRSLSVTDDDLDELKACIELGFGFESGSDSPDFDRRLSDTLPALGLYYAVNKSFSDSMSVSSTAASSSSSGDGSSSPLDSPHHILSLNDGNPEVVKARLRQWAQVVACTVRQSSDFPSGVRSEKMV